METIKLWDKTPYFNPEIKDQKEPSLTPYLFKKSDRLRPCVIVFPGGAYVMKAIEHEGYRVAEMLNSHGIDAFVCDYRVAPYRHPVELCDANRAVRFVRHHAAEYGIDPHKIGVLGFSAGGHLAASASVHYAPCAEPADDVDKESARPDFSVFCYSVISSGEHMHVGSFQNLLGDKFNDPELMEYYSCEKQVTPDCAPAFIWTTAPDSVHCENSILMAEAYWRNKVPCALHVFHEGGHGLGLADARFRTEFYMPTVSQWGDMCAAWIYDITDN